MTQGWAVRFRTIDSSMSILVTGTGGGAGQSVLKSLQGTDYRVIAADGEVLGTGLYTTGKGYVIPYASSPQFVPRLLEICQAEGVRMLFPGLDAELPILSAQRDAFAAVGVTVVVGEMVVVGVMVVGMLGVGVGVMGVVVAGSIAIRICRIFIISFDPDPDT